MAEVYHQNGTRADHQTPPALMWWLQQLIKSHQLGSITLDVAATVRSAVAAEYFTPEEDGLAQSWASSGLYFCNPPYGRKHKIHKWLAKGCQEAEEHGQAGWWLIPARPGTQWWWQYVKQWPHYFLQGRITYWLDGRPMCNSAGFPSALVAMGMDKLGDGVNYLDWQQDLAEFWGLDRPGVLATCSIIPAHISATGKSSVICEKRGWKLVQHEPWGKKQQDRLLAGEPPF